MEGLMDEVWEGEDDEEYGESDDEEANARKQDPLKDQVVFLVDARMLACSLLSNVQGEEGGALESLLFFDGISDLGVKCHTFAAEKKSVQSGTSSLLTQVIMGIKDVYRHKARLRKQDEVAIVFYSSTIDGGDEVETQYPNVYALRKMSPPRLDAVKFLAGIDDEWLDNEISQTGQGESSLLPLRDGLSLSVSMLKHGKGVKKIVLITNDDDPGKGSDDQQFMNRAAAIIPSNCELILIGIDPPKSAWGGSEFDDGKFFARIHKHEKAGFTYSFIQVSSPAEELSALKDELVRQSEMLRPQKKLNLFLSSNEDDAIGVALYTIFKEETIPRPQKVDQATNEPLKPSTVYKDPYEKTVQGPFSRVYEYGMDDELILDENELWESKSLMGTGLYILGFEPMSCLKDYHQVRSSTFVYPWDDAIRNSSAAFAALHRAMVDNDLMALAWFCRGGKGNPVHQVALIPQRECRDEEGVQVLPEGFHMIYLPYWNDIREPKGAAIKEFSEEPREPSEEGVEKAISLLEAVSLESYDPADYPNPKLSRHFQIIEEIGSGGVITRDEADPSDPTHVDMSRLEQSGCLESLSDFHVSVFGTSFPFAGGHTKQGTKRKGHAQQSQPTSSPHNDEHLKESIRSGQVWQMTNNQIKDELRSRGCAVTGKKADLISRLEQNIGA